MSRSLTIWLVTMLLLNSEAAEFDPIVRDFGTTVGPLLERYCHDCHDGANRKGELDLEHFRDLESIRSAPKVWQQVRQQIETGEMPPAKKPQPTANERATLLAWVTQYLRAEASANAGDPGPVVLRRLSNAEYTYTLRDLTGITSLDSGREFPADNAAGEGFANAGAAMVMSPALLAKYLSAAKSVASHAVLLPRGIAFSAKTTSRDWTDEKVTAIREFYARFTKAASARSIHRPGINLNLVDGGALPLERYFAATIHERKRLRAGTLTLAEVATRHQLSAKYLTFLWQALNDSRPSFLLDGIRDKWRTIPAPDAGELAAMVQAWQAVLWRFASVGHIGKRNGPKSWQIPVLPLVAAQELTVKLPAKTGGKELSLYLAAGDNGDGNTGDAIVWRGPRIVFTNRPPILLRNLSWIDQRLDELIPRELARTSEYLTALGDWHANGGAAENFAAAHNLHPQLLKSWAALTGIRSVGRPQPEGHFTRKRTAIGGYAELRGWGRAATPVLNANRSTDVIRFSTLTIPGRSVTIHPSPTEEAVVYWRSPVTGEVRVNGLVADADSVCGNGVTWQVELIQPSGTTRIAVGKIANGAKQEFAAEGTLTVAEGDLVRLSVNPGNRSHVCDTTHVELTVTEAASPNREWDLAEQVVDRILESNPLSDSFGNPDVWHFGMSRIGRPSHAPEIGGTPLAAWRDAVLAGESAATRREKAAAVKVDMVPALHDPLGPLDWLSLARASAPVQDSAAEDIAGSAPQVWEIKLPRRIVAGAEFSTTGILHPEKGREGSVQLRAQLTKPAAEPGLVAGTLNVYGQRRQWTDGVQPVRSDSPIIVNEGSRARERVLADIREFRALFPAAVCYTKIVPVDEVVTLTLFHREDDPLQRLVLDDRQAAELDRLWSELRFVSRDALKLVDVYEQLWQFATQDASPNAFEPLRKPIHDRAAQFRGQLVAAEPHHLNGVLKFAARAWRHPLGESDRKELRDLYARLRGSELDHEAAIRLTLARVLVAPKFLYKSERPDAKTGPITGSELAVRLSYFLWATGPDDELLAAAAGLPDESQLLRQTRRLLHSDKVRRLALEFGCQWLGIRDFDQLDEKNDRLYPQFKFLREPMREESVRFFTDLFRNNRSILSLLAADHTFVNPQLAEFYGVAKPATGWERIAGLRKYGRGGILGMAATLARQSGASRTSPILRGNWIYESLLGKRLPSPPADVPQLPDVLPAGLTARQLIERHSGDPACARCHVLIDPYGFALEAFDAIGRDRETAATTATLPDGKTITGLNGLREYLLNHRREEFVRQFCRKLLGYALGRSVQLSDEPLLDTMLRQLAIQNYSAQTAIEMIVKSPQFREIRGRN
jgi:hypothetical protein